MRLIITSFLLFAALVIPSQSSTLDVKIVEGKKVGNATVLKATVDDNPTTNAVTLWWCTRAPRLSDSDVYQLKLAGTDTSFTCKYTGRADGLIADCSCTPDTLVPPESCDVTDIWSQETSQGNTIFARLSCEYPVSSSVAVGFAAELQTNLQVGGAYESDRWVFLFDHQDDPRIHREYSLGRVVNNGSGYTVSQSGDWVETRVPDTPVRDGRDRTKQIYCALVRLQDTGTVDDYEAYSVIADRFGITVSEMEKIVVSVTKGFESRNDYSIDKYCAGY
jgi:hypothetical protein